MMKIAAVIFAVSISAILETFQFRVPRAAAIAKDNAAPTAPACVGVNIPVNRPPKTPTTSKITGHVSLRASSRSDHVALSSSDGASAGLIHTRTMITAQYPSIVSTPGTIAARNSLLIATSAKIP